MEQKYLDAVAVDFECYYDHEISIRTLGSHRYARETDTYLVSVWGHGVSYVGHPKDFDWESVRDRLWVSHNAAFDSTIYEALVEKGVVPFRKPDDEWYCTADMVAFFGCPRSLRDASKHYLGLDLSKETRDQMRGRKWESMSEAFRKEVCAYALKDSELCLKLFWSRISKWPETEVRLHILTREMGKRGLPVDPADVDNALAELDKQIFDMTKLIPWSDERSPLSHQAFYAECRKHNLTPPKSIAKDCDEATEWAANNPEVGGPWLQAMRDLRSAQVLQKKVKTLKSRIIDGRFIYGLKYAGAHTLRDSGDAGFNVQNMPREEMFGVDVRGFFKAPKDKVLVVSDLSQIEPRTLAYLAGDRRMLDIAASGVDWYEAQARAWGMWDKPEPLGEADPNLRHLVKQLNLGLGYGMSANKFSAVTGVPIREAKRVVSQYRQRNPKVTRLWKVLSERMRQSHGENFEIGLLSGRSLKYLNVKRENGGSCSAVIKRSEKWMRLHFWHGLLIENLVQATARDVFMDRVLAVSNAGFDIILRVHDEIVCEVDADRAQEAAAAIHKIMTTPPEWMRDIPLGSQTKILNQYTK